MVELPQEMHTAMEKHIGLHAGHVWVTGNGHVALVCVDRLEVFGDWTAHESPITAVLPVGDRVWFGLADGTMAMWHMDQEVRLTGPWSCDGSGGVMEVLICIQDQSVTFVSSVHVHQAPMRMIRAGQHVWTVGHDRMIVLWDAKVRVRAFGRERRRGC